MIAVRGVGRRHHMDLLVVPRSFVATLRIQIIIIYVVDVLISLGNIFSVLAWSIFFEVVDAWNVWFLMSR